MEQTTCRYCGKQFGITGIGSHTKYCSKRPPLAVEVLQTWEDRKTTFPVRHLAKKFDPKVEITKLPDHQITIYSFSDESILIATGRGQNFYLKVDKPAQL